MDLEYERIVDGTIGGYDFERHFTFYTGFVNGMEQEPRLESELRSEAAFTVLKLVEISLVDPDIAPILSLELKIPQFVQPINVSMSARLIEETAYCGIVPQAPFLEVVNREFVVALNRVSEKHRELREELDEEGKEAPRVSSQQQILATALALLQASGAKERREIIKRHAEEFVSLHVSV